ncbi:unnamed protein product, partial [Urochloa humidicola]
HERREAIDASGGAACARRKELAAREAARAGCVEA